MNIDQEKKQFTLDIWQKKSVILPREQQPKQKKGSSLAYYMGSAGSIGFAILIPLLGGIAVGIWMDNQYGTKPQFTIGGLVVGLILSVANLAITVKNIIKQV